jgi:hypothetical protein
MANVFNGKEFLSSKAVDIELSNGFKTKVQEINDVQMDKLAELGKVEEPTTKEIRATVANLLDADVESLTGIGLIELRGVMDFLTERLFG